MSVIVMFMEGGTIGYEIWASKANFQGESIIRKVLAIEISWCMTVR